MQGGSLCTGQETSVYVESQQEECGSVSPSLTQKKKELLLKMGLKERSLARLLCEGRKKKVIKEKSTHSEKKKKKRRKRKKVLFFCA